MRLKIFVSAMLLAGLIMLLGGPWIIGKRPPISDKRATKVYAVRLTGYMSAMLLTFTAAAIGSSFIIRNVKKEFIDEAHVNVQMLVEGTLNDHKSKNQS